MICLFGRKANLNFTTTKPIPDDLILIEVEPTTVIMEGIYRIDELARYHSLVPSDRSILELNPGWTSSLNLGKGIATDSLLH